MPKVLLVRLASARQMSNLLLTSQGCDCLAIALCSCQLFPGGQICEQSLFSKTCSQNAPVFTERYASARVDWLQCALNLVGCPDRRSLRHGVALICFELQVLLRMRAGGGRLEKLLIDSREVAIRVAPDQDQG